MNDKKVLVIEASRADEFADKLNAVLSEGDWRIEKTEIYVTMHHYFALLIQSAPEKKAST